ncbi:MAG: NUDIX hydrolase [Puniceicoccaceae bacterium 5H]|nr:MAG: NUDIX hydrolase [Puniceicoccaceae bacterium 5H]
MSRIKQIRSAARAVIIHDGKLLATKMRDWRGVYYILPGGGQQPGETLEDAVKRECLEEVGVEVEVDRLLYVREYIGRNHRFSKSHSGFHQLEHVFRCHITDPHAVCIGHECDNHQIGVAWLALENIQAVPFYPAVIKQYFTLEGIEVPTLYLGDCN